MISLWSPVLFVYLLLSNEVVLTKHTMGREKWHGILGKSLLPSQELTVAAQKEASSAGKHSKNECFLGSLTFYKTKMKWDSEAPEMTFPCPILLLTHPMNFSWLCQCHTTSFTATVKPGSQSQPGKTGLKCRECTQDNLLPFELLGTLKEQL